MEPFGTSRMYACQAPAFAARDELVGIQTDSTPEHPPHHDTPDWRRLCDLKLSIVQSLPTACSHCGAVLEPEFIIERRDGDIVAYCKTKGACGKSQVLFAAVDPTYPVYTKFCPFRTAEAEIPQPAVIDPTSVAAQQGQIFGESAAAPAEPPTEATIPPDVLNRLIGLDSQTQELDVYALHGITRPDAPCALCNRPYRDHERGCDQNGWKETRRALYDLPADWPVFDPATHKWKAEGVLARGLRQVRNAIFPSV